MSFAPAAGARVLATPPEGDADSALVPARVLRARDDRCLVHFVGFPSKFDAWVDTSSLSPAPPVGALAPAAPKAVVAPPAKTKSTPQAAGAVTTMPAASTSSNRRKRPRRRVPPTAAASPCASPPPQPRPRRKRSRGGVTSRSVSSAGASSSASRALVTLAEDHADDERTSEEEKAVSRRGARRNDENARDARVARRDASPTAMEPAGAARPLRLNLGRAAGAPSPSSPPPLSPARDSPVALGSESFRFDAPESGGERKKRQRTAAVAEGSAPSRKRVELKYGGGRRKPAQAGDAEHNAKLRELRAYYDVVDRHSLTLVQSS